MRKLNITAGAGNCPAYDLSTKDNYYFDGVYLDETQKEYPSAVNITSQKELSLFAVCDGKGENGFISSYYAMDYLDKYNDRLYSEDSPNWDFTLKNYLANTNRLINIERACPGILHTSAGRNRLVLDKYLRQPRRRSP